MALPLHPLHARRNHFQRALLRWFGTYGRDLPWRQRRDPYAILVSEIMLQQTQVATVVGYFRGWLERFPDFAALARADESEVLHAWQGLGYYNRARNLHATAKIIARDFAGMLPNDPEAISRLPGLGRYTANAVATFAFDQSVPIVEANIARLLARLLDLQIPIDTAAGRAALWQTAAKILPTTNAREFNSALMDFGATICRPREPKCLECALKEFCRASRPNELPIKSPRQKLALLTERHAFTLRRDRVLLEQSRERWRGLWILPTLLDPRDATPLHISQFPFTHHRITLQVFAQPRHSKLADTHRWFPRDEVGAIPMPSPHRRALTHLLARTRTAA